VKPLGTLPTDTLEHPKWLSQALTERQCRPLEEEIVLLCDQLADTRIGPGRNRIVSRIETAVYRLRRVRRGLEETP
jgi:hypothetical protein